MLIDKMTKEELIAEMESLEQRAFDIIDDESMSHEFNTTMAKAKSLHDFAKKQGWI